MDRMPTICLETLSFLELKVDAKKIARICESKDVDFQVFKVKANREGELDYTTLSLHASDLGWQYCAINSWETLRNG